MQQRFGNVRVLDIVDENGMTGELLSLSPRLLFCANNDIQNVTIVTFSDASHSSKNDVYGQSGIILSLKIEADTFTWYHPLIRSSRKERKVCYSSFGAETLSAVNADDRDFYLKKSLSLLFLSTDIKYE